MTALPPRAARVLAFVAILVGGLCGGLIGWSVTELQCGPERGVAVGPPTTQRGGRPAPTTTTTVAADDDDGCTVISGVGGLVGAALGAGGVAVIAVLVLRAMGEWRQIEREQRE